MKSKVKILIPLIASLLTLTSCREGGGGGGGGGGDTSTSGYADVGAVQVSPTDWNGYYSEFAGALAGSGSELQFALHKLCVKTHTTIIRYSQFYSYTSASTKPRSIDQSATDENKNVAFYTGAEIDKNKTYTREHVWPCANSSNLWVHDKSANQYYVDGSSYWGGGSDLYHVRPSSSYVNTARGNSKFIEFQEGDTYYLAEDDGTKTSAKSYNYAGGKYVLKVDSDPAAGFANKCEPANEYKGDIARIIMYVYVHYTRLGGQEWNWFYDEAKTKCVMGALNLRQVFAYDDQEEMFETIYRWSKNDPVDDHERLRNDAIQQIQGNRNPFVDYPDLIARCFQY